jgi:dihydroneopterin aldolase
MIFQDKPYKSMGQLVLENMEFYAYHGHYDEEQTIGGKFSVDLVIDTDLSKAAESDSLDSTVDYSKVYELVKKEMGKPSRLLEHLALRIIKAVYTASDHITSVKATVSKLNPAIGGNMGKFSVVLTR